jgi:hypothetical protein
VHESRARADGCLVVLEIHAVDELRLAGEVDVVGAASAQAPTSASPYCR